MSRLARVVAVPLALAALALATRPAAAAPAALRLPASVVAGTTVTIRWSALPADVEEAELVLSLDGGRTFPVRVSPELEPREGAFLWRVPDLPGEGAVLLLRIGGEEGERPGAISGPFRIVHAPGAAAPDLEFREGGLWAGVRPLRGPRPAGLASRQAGLRTSPEEPPCSVTSTAAGDERPCAAASLPAPRASAAAPADPPASDRFRREVPLRI